MAAPDADRAAVKALANQRDALDAEMAAIYARLNAPGQPGATGSLLDAEARARVRSACVCAPSLTLAGATGVSAR